MHTLAGYFREQGAEVLTLRAGFPDALDEFAPDLVVLSPGPGRPADFACAQLLDRSTCAGCPPSGCAWACRPWWSTRAANWRCSASPFTASPAPSCGPGRRPACSRASRREFTAARYHSLHAVPRQVKGGFEVTAVTADGW